MTRRTILDDAKRAISRGFAIRTAASADSLRDVSATADRLAKFARKVDRELRALIAMFPDDTSERHEGWSQALVLLRNRLGLPEIP